ncbi:hypothetical protein IWZ03DRAFT_13721 [Phyllosticta citriasiana]|uniref:Uncharacterized protein n=1 Tax=Phyllosticta citriasiana TaxID=595635 RepID=A0ABR1KZW5_9PEZI
MNGTLKRGSGRTGGRWVWSIDVMICLASLLLNFPLSFPFGFLSACLSIYLSSICLLIIYAVVSVQSCGSSSSLVFQLLFVCDATRHDFNNVTEPTSPTCG